MLNKNQSQVLKETFLFAVGQKIEYIFREVKLCFEKWMERYAMRE